MFPLRILPACARCQSHRSLVPLLLNLKMRRDGGARNRVVLEKLRDTPHASDLGHEPNKPIPFVLAHALVRRRNCPPLTVRLSMDLITETSSSTSHLAQVHHYLRMLLPPTLSR